VAEVQNQAGPEVENQTVVAKVLTQAVKNALGQPDQADLTEADQGHATVTQSGPGLTNSSPPLPLPAPLSRSASPTR